MRHKLFQTIVFSFLPAIYEMHAFDQVLSLSAAWEFYPFMKCFAFPL